MLAGKVGMPRPPAVKKVCWQIEPCPDCGAQLLLPCFPTKTRLIFFFLLCELVVFECLVGRQRGAAVSQAQFPRSRASK